MLSGHLICFIFILDCFIYTLILVWLVYQRTNVDYGTSNYLSSFLLFQPGHFQGHTYDIISAFQVCTLCCSFDFWILTWELLLGMFNYIFIKSVWTLFCIVYSFFIFFFFFFFFSSPCCDLLPGAFNMRESKDFGYFSTLKLECITMSFCTT